MTTATIALISYLNTDDYVEWFEMWGMYFQHLPAMF